MKRATKHELESKIELYLMHLKDDLARVKALKDTDNIDFKYARLSQLHSNAKALADFTDIYLTDAFEGEPDEIQSDTPIKKDSSSKSCKINVIKDYDDLLHFIQIITNEGCVVDKIENIPLQTLTDFTESGNETDKNEKDRYYIILYHKKEEE